MKPDPQLPLEPTVRIDPSTQVQHMPGTDAVCICQRGPALPDYPCLWPFCSWKDHANKEDT